MIDLLDKEKTVRAHHAIGARLARHLKAWPAAGALFTIAYGVFLAGGLHAHAPTGGTIRGLAIGQPATIYRDSRGIPHIRARSQGAAFFAQGFAEGSDRLFQMDLIRRYALGELSQMLGPIQLQNDEALRAFDVRDIVARQWTRLSSRDRAALEAFAAGVNAAVRSQPLPLEFRLLLYRPRPWSGRDSLAVAMALAISVSDSAENVLQRDAVWRASGERQFARLLPLSDPSYDVAIDGAQAPVRTQSRLAWQGPRGLTYPAAGSNAWAAGDARARSRCALLANDPHLNLSIPGIWYALELRAPGLHAAGVTIPGLPGVVLGHNERIAWATTNAMASTVSLFDAGKLDRANWRTETFHVRFAPDAVKQYYRSAHEFAIAARGETYVLERWPLYDDSRSPVTTIFALDRAQSTGEAIAALAKYAGPPQNFFIADDGGRVAYHLAGIVPDDPAWGRYVHPARDLRLHFRPVPFEKLPAIAPSRDALAMSANNKMYAAGYPYRLSPMFAPPYRAYRIAALLRARRSFDTGYFARMQLDTNSPADAQFAHDVAAFALKHPGMLTAAQIRALRAWDGSFGPGSTAATLERGLREAVESVAISPYAPFDAFRDADSTPAAAQTIREAGGAAPHKPWAQAGAVDVLHPFGPIGFPFLNVAPFPGNGDRYTIRVQTGDIAQSFRAVWCAGDWKRGGVSLPAGESGEIGSPHYDDLRGAWIAGTLQPLPFSDADVLRDARDRLILKN